MEQLNPGLKKPRVSSSRRQPTIRRDSETKGNASAPMASASAASSAGLVNSRQRFLEACACRSLDYPPVWLMRQAGRALPEYRALKQKYTFLELVQTPELATEVTLQPIRRFGFDAAILFSDILVIAEGLGQGYQFRDEGGIQMDFLIGSSADVDRLDVEAVLPRLDYIGQALRLVKTELGGRQALIGFAGSPWTLANFMIQGGGVREYTKAKTLFYSDRRIFDRLMEKLTAAITRYLNMQIEAGADAVQIFDSLAGELSDGTFGEASARWIKEIIGGLKGNVPVIVFSKGAHGNWKTLAETDATVLGVDWNANLAEIRSRIPAHIAVQGNLDPFVLTTNPEIVAAETKRILYEMKGKAGHIFNLGHGVPPNAKLENIRALVDTIRGEV
jgi:uroporphyrinogen decarboxylase